MGPLVRMHADKLGTLLAERLAFEKLQVRLYDATIAKVERAAAPAPELLPRLRTQRDDEREHVQWLEERVRELGVTPPDDARAGELASHGLFELVLRPDESVARTLAALHGAAILDHAGWAVLVELATEAGDDEARDAFRRRLWEEHEHKEHLHASLRGASAASDAASLDAEHRFGRPLAA